jgi:hypothetical protein
MTALAWADSPVISLDGLVSTRDATIEIDAERRRRAAARAPAWAAEAVATQVWVLKSPRAGDASQVLALAEGLGLPFEVKELSRRSLDVLRAPPFAATLAGLEPASAALLRAPWPALVLSAGRENEPVARWIRKASGGATKIVHVGRPWGPIDGYDLVVTTPQYRLPERPNVLQSLFGITNSTKDILTIVNVGDQTKLKLYNAQNPANEGSDKVSYVFTFPGLAVEDGQRYTVCTLSTENFNLKCEHGNNSPLNRPEFVDIKVSETPSKKELGKTKS